MLTFVMIMIAIVITCYVNDIINDHINMHTINTWNNKLQHHTNVIEQMREDIMWSRMAHEAYCDWKKMKTREIVLQHICAPEEDNNTEQENTWHDLMAQRILVGGVWAYNMYTNRRRIMLGMVEPEHLDPRNMPTAEQAEKQEQENMINNIKLMVRLGEMAHEMYLNMKWSVKQAYYRYRSERARDITPGRVRTLTHTTTGGSTTPATIPTYTYQTSVQ